MGNYWLDKDKQQDAQIFLYDHRQDTTLFWYDRQATIGFNLIKDGTESGIKWFARDGGFVIGDVLFILNNLIDKKLAQLN